MFTERVGSRTVVSTTRVILVVSSFFDGLPWRNCFSITRLLIGERERKGGC